MLTVVKTMQLQGEDAGKAAEQNKKN